MIYEAKQKLPTLWQVGDYVSVIFPPTELNPCRVIKVSVSEHSVTYDVEVPFKRDGVTAFARIHSLREWHLRRPEETKHQDGQKQVILDLPKGSKERERRVSQGLPPNISVDTEIVDAIKALWEKGIETSGCCSGHGTEFAWVQVYPECFTKMFDLGYIQRPPEYTGNGSVFGLYAFYL